MLVHLSKPTGVSLVLRQSSNPGFARTDAKTLLHFKDEDLAVPDVPGARSPSDRVDGLPHPVVADSDLDLDLVEQSSPLHMAPVDLSDALLPSSAQTVRDGQKDDLFLFEGRDYLVQPVGLDDCDDVLRPGCSSSRLSLAHQSVGGFTMLCQIQPDVFVIDRHSQPDHFVDELEKTPGQNEGIDGDARQRDQLK